MKLDLQLLQKEIEAGNVFSTRHPTLPLTLYKYTKTCVYSKSWNDITLKCRGLVLDDEGNIVLNPMPKFFNHFEEAGQKTLERNKDLEYVVTDKYDGSLINFGLYKGELLVCSSGSFISKQSEKAREIILKKGIDKKLELGLTYCAEVIYPLNKIVLDYKDRESLDIFDIRDISGNDAQFGLVKEGLIPSEKITIEEILAELPRKDFINKEGYILTYSNGDRVKFKYDEYMRLHKIISGINEKFIWEALRDEVEISFENIPDELFEFIETTQKTLRAEFDKLMERVLEGLEAIKVFETRKDKALHLKEFYPEVMSLVFGALDQRNISKEVWKRLEPENTRTGMGEKT